MTLCIEQVQFSFFSAKLKKKPCRYKHSHYHYVYLFNQMFVAKNWEWK